MRKISALALGPVIAALLAARAAVGAEAAPAGSRAGEAPPRDPAAGGLIADLEKMVEVQQSLGWTIDRYEIDEVMPPALMSVCSATPEARAAALAELARRIAALGGPVEEAFRRRGGDLGAVADLLFATRVRALLDEATRRAGTPHGPSTDCPFWLRPSPAFRGRETDAYRTTLNLEGGGLVGLEGAGGRVLAGAGGSARLMLGRGINERWTFLSGAELGGTAQLEQTDQNTRFPISFVAALPIALRYNDRTWHYEGEIASLAYFTQDDLRVSPGLRVGALVGVSALRVRNIMPWAGLGIALEHVFETSWRPRQWHLKGGARVGFDWAF
ncbi:uncharacterized protein SOCE26_022770 [Sorangium cellulosum]|uniref:Secreted protein n=1 Tax=Sorangium cellulosum TaxID=56 RepID=A0A2L0ENM1_SORCE|nr:hypothetical protein [Sorangium cellulosum]AUX40875.1 uncharacterized protein SOCE26_022770 [Sorangium cellulosum]